MEEKELDVILKKHNDWLCGNENGERANLYDADFSYANLSNANLSYANLSGANLRRANLSGTDLSNADLSGADLNNANLFSVIFIHADLRGATFANTIAMTQCPEDGSFVAWKKCRNDVLVKLLIPEDAKRSSATSRKCRASKAQVLEIIGADEAVSKYDASFIYRVGELVEVENFDEDRWNECSTGIHFFITRAEAENH